MGVRKTLKRLYLKYCISVKEGQCLFVPHPGFTRLDKASIINYKADNCLIFVRYLLDNKLYQGREIYVVSTTPENAAKEQDFCKKNYPDAPITIVPNHPKEIKRIWAASQYVMCSEDRFPYEKKKGQKYITLSYYPISLKNDYFEPTDPVMGERLKFASEIDMIVSSSLINSQMDSAAFSISFGKFLPIGKCRSDVLMQKEDVGYVRDYLQQLCLNYSFKKVVLYTPTHRDYELANFDVKRSILGFDVDKERFSKFLKSHGILIICKLHPRQNAEVVNGDLPEGVVNFTGYEQFGLIELMKASDMLMTDYTSAYVDYLQLDKPVIFNLYDLDKYEQTRGLSFHPFERICAGEIFHDEQSFYQAVEDTLKHPNKYELKRKEILEEMITYRTDVCNETYKTIFS